MVVEGDEGTARGLSGVRPTSVKVRFLVGVKGLAGATIVPRGGEFCVANVTSVTSLV